MLPPQVTEALSSLSTALSAAPSLAHGLHTRWHSAGYDKSVPLAAEIAAAADIVDRALPTLTRSQQGVNDLGQLFGSPTGDVVFIWCTSNAARRDARLARLLAIASSHQGVSENVVHVARDRIVEGPLLDSLACAPLLGTGDSLGLPENGAAAARMEILLWEAGASALAVPELGPWIWGSSLTFDAVIATPAHGSLRGRVLAARCLEVSVRGMPPTADPELVGRTLQILQPLLLHPEPLVWVHAARALGRLTGTMEQLEATLMDWALGNTPLLRQRATTAFASLPAERIKVYQAQLLSIIDSSDTDANTLAALAAATPYLFFEKRDLWDRVAQRIFNGDGGAVSARALARGLGTLWRRGTQQNTIEGPLRQLREMARRATSESLGEWRRWIEVMAVSDPIDAAERDPLDLELGLENLVRLAAQYDDEEADARAARFAEALSPTFIEARRIALGSGSLRHRAAGMNAFEGCARSLALRLWGPQLATRPAGDPIEEPDLQETWKMIARTPAELLDIVRERRQTGTSDHETDIAIEVLALRLGGYALDALGEDSDLGPGRGGAAHDTCLWLRKLEGLADGSRDLPSNVKTSLSALFWRLVDTTRGTALGEVDDVRWLGPFAAWWALVIDRPTMLLSIATALPMIADGALEKCCALADNIRIAIASGAEDGAWGKPALEALTELHAEDTELAHALESLSAGLGRFAAAAGPKPNLEAMCLDLVLAAERLHGALADPVKALHPATQQSADDSLGRAASENAPRVASLIARAIRQRELAVLDVWFTSLGPVTSAMVEAAVRGAVKRSPPPPPAPKKKEPKFIEGYELLKPIGEGGIGSVYLVRKPGAERMFVLKIPKADALAGASDTEREGILTSFVEEAKALAGLYHPNVANIIDRGVAGNIPFLVLELLIGADLKQYAAPKLMSLFELKSVVLETCAGLAALHNAGLVHRDIKPANLWLRLPLGGNDKFDPEKHRDPARTNPLATVVIDFGMVRAMRVSPEAGGKFVAGTPGYIAPEQVLDPVELDGRADVYALAGTIYNVTTGRTFFDDLESPRDRIIAHMNRDPLEDVSRTSTYPAALVKLLRAATAKEPKDRPTPMEFGRAFAGTI